MHVGGYREVELSHNTTELYAIAKEHEKELLQYILPMINPDIGKRINIIMNPNVFDIDLIVEDVNTHLSLMYIEVENTPQWEYEALPPYWSHPSFLYRKIKSYVKSGSNNPVIYIKTSNNLSSCYYKSFESIIRDISNGTALVQGDTSERLGQYINYKSWSDVPFGFRKFIKSLEMMILKKLS